jgi:hypothetical protein
MKKTFLTLTVVGFLVGCGGGGGNKTTSSNTDDSLHSNNTQENTEQNQGGTPTSSPWSPVTSNFTCDPDAFNIRGQSIDSRYAAEGGIKVACKTFGGYTSPEYSLVDTDLPYIEVAEYTKTERVSGVSRRYGNFTTVDTYNLKTGKHHIKGSTSSGFSIDCVETYDVRIPLTYNSDKIDKLIDLDFDNFNMTETTCPDSYYETDYIDDFDDDINDFGSGTFRIDIVITDTNGKVSKISTEIVGK